MKTLRPRVKVAPQRIQSAKSGDNRMRGRAGVERRAKWLRAHPLCIDCEAEGKVTAAEEVDHEVPLWQGGADNESNFASRCIPCHKAKTDREAKVRGSLSAWNGSSP